MVKLVGGDFQIHPVAAQIVVPTELVSSLFFWTCLSVPLQSVLEKRGLFHIPKRLEVGRPRVEFGRFVVAERFPPPEGAQAPFVTRFEAGESVMRIGRAQVVTAHARKVEKLLRHFGANDVSAVVASVRLAVSVPPPSGQRIGAAQLQGSSLDVGVTPAVVRLHLTTRHHQQDGRHRHQHS